MNYVNQASDLSQKALVTVASSGIGKQEAIALGHTGADVAVNYVTDADKAQEALQEIGRHCGIEATDRRGRPFIRSRHRLGATH